MSEQSRDQSLFPPMASAPEKAPINKAKAAGVSARSFLDLQAELASKKEEFLNNKAAKRPAAKKPTVWSRTNKGVNARAARDIELDAISKPTLDSARAILERKSRLYEKLRKGKSVGLSEKQYDSLLVDFNSKVNDNYSLSDDDDGDDVDESLAVPKHPDAEEDPIIEFQDEFGRLRTAPSSQVPRDLLPTCLEDDPIIEYEDEFGRVRSAQRSTIPAHLRPPDPEDEDPSVIYNPVEHFPVYEPSADRVAEIEKEYAEENNPLNIHYNATKEVRAKGAGFYQLSGDDETRERQLEELRLAREETAKGRQDTGAVDIKPGEVEGMQLTGSTSRALDKRKRELEERRRLVDAKRRKVKGNVDGKGSESDSHPTAVLRTASHTIAVHPRHTDVSSPSAVLRSPVEKTVNPADVFLEQLEKDILGNKSL